MAGVIMQPFIPPEIIQEAVIKLGKKADRLMESIDSSEYTTFLGLPCNPNESKLCLKRTTTTTIEPQSPLKQRRASRMSPKHQPKPETSDYERAPQQATEFDRIIQIGREAFNQQKSIAEELEKERKNRQFLNHVNLNQRFDIDDEPEEMKDHKQIESLKSNSFDYKKKQSQSTSALVQAITGREPNLRGWFPDHGWDNRQVLSTNIETARRRRRLLSKKETHCNQKLRRLAKEEKVSSNTTSSEHYNISIQIPYHENSDEIVESATTANKGNQQSNIWTLSWLERFLPMTIWKHSVVPDFILLDNNDEDFDDEEWVDGGDDCADDDEDCVEDDEDCVDDDEDCVEDDDCVDDEEIIEIMLVTTDGDVISNNTADIKNDENSSSILFMPLSLFEHFPFSWFKNDDSSLNSTDKDEDTEKLNVEDFDLKESKIHIDRALDKAMPLFDSDRESEEILLHLTDSEKEVMKDVVRSEQEGLGPSFRDFRQIPDFFDFMNLMLPGFIQHEELA